MESNIYYLHGVIDTLKDIIANNTNIKINLSLKYKDKDKDKDFEIIDDNESQHNTEIIDKLDTAKNYIVLMDQMCNNRIKLLFKTNICDYIILLEKNIIEITDKLKLRGLEDKKINNLLKTKFLKSFEMKFLLKYNYEDISLTNDDISFLQDTSKSRYNYSKYKIFNKEVFIKSFLNYTISIFDINDMFNIIITNEYCNIKYIPQVRSKLDDPYSFYYIEKIDNDKIYWTMDCRLHNISNDICEHVLEYCIDLFRTIYYRIYHDNIFRENFDVEQDILQYEGIQLLKNIHKLCCPYNFTINCQQLFIDCMRDNNHDEDSFKFNLKSDDTQQKSLYKELKTDYNVNDNFKETISLLFDSFDENNFSIILEKIN
jgi:broad-specificity NMP kinase